MRREWQEVERELVGRAVKLRRSVFRHNRSFFRYTRISGFCVGDGTIQRFRPGVERILAQRPVPVVPLALRGLWGSIFSRHGSAVGRLRLPRRFWSRIDLVAGAPVPPEQATAELLEERVRELRGDAA